MTFSKEDLAFFKEMEEEQARQDYLEWLSEEEKAYSEREAIKAWCRWLLREPE